MSSVITVLKQSDIIQGNSHAWLFFSRNVFGILDTFVFHVHFRGAFQILLKSGCNFVEDFFEPVDNLGKIGILQY